MCKGRTVFVMGVEGLAGFIECNRAFIRGRNFRESRLIIDGYGLCIQLYLKSPLDQKYGGEYAAFEDIVKQFFKNLEVCSIEPYVVLDGGNYLSERKIHKTEKTFKERVRKAVALTRGRPGEMLPVLAKKVFKQILYKLKVLFIQCLTEADWELAALANDWNCPVLSNNSYFYILPIRGGVLPIDHFQWRNVSRVARRCSTEPYIPTKCYGYLNVCTFYNRMNWTFLPLFATILGDSNLCSLDKNTFPTWAEFSSMPGRHAEMDGLLKWLSRFNGPKRALAALLSKKKPNDTIRKKIYQGMQKYRLQRSSSIEQFFISGEPQIRPTGPLQNLPDWILEPFAEGELSSSISDVLMFRRVAVRFQVEDFTLSSSSEASWLIRQVKYGVLLCTRSQNSKYNHRYEVEEYDRQGTKLACFMVPAVLPRCAGSDLYLETLWETPHCLRLRVLLEALRVSPLPEFLLIPEHLQLAVYVTSFWLQHAQPEPGAETFWALLIVLVYGQLRREHRTEIEAGTVIGRLEGLRSRKGKKILILELAHAYSQWQRCLKDAYILNQLLNNPVPEPELSRLYCGSLVHCVARELMSGVEPECLLAGASLAVKLYRDLQAAAEHDLDVEFVDRLRTRRGPSRPRAPEEDEPNETGEDERDDDGDGIYEVTCEVRSRDVSQGRARNPRSKKHERVRWQ